MPVTLAGLEFVAAIFADFPYPWFVSGGWAIDLFRGDVTREHEDLEIGIFRRDQRAAHFLLEPAWELEKAVDTGVEMAWVRWYQGEFLELPIHQVRVSRPAGNPPEFELFLNDTQGNEWFFRRNAEIRRPETSLWTFTDSGIPYLRPEIQLLYKARLLRDKDRHDFEGSVGRLDATARRWLKMRLESFLPGHKWLTEL